MPKYACQKCSKEFKDNKGLNYHEVKKVCEGKNFKCNYCNTVFSLQCTFDRHIKKCAKKENDDSGDSDDSGDGDDSGDSDDGGDSGDGSKSIHRCLRNKEDGIGRRHRLRERARAGTKESYAEVVELLHGLP